MLLLDIETYSPDGFPDIENANHPINVITVHDNLENKFYTWGTKEYTGKGRKNLKYTYCETERVLFSKFLDCDLSALPFRPSYRPLKIAFLALLDSLPFLFPFLLL